ncbi:polyamine aminopropyltransferase [Armatimonas rosea]|uniref:Polyamine aminopropyltransferase n=1 Tax=Armatimonas rosea TaxID=685828 RepID=A0A7W9SUN3_ARMRO|nr:polyamine aminopropyltransferase [Armatimonas rosea]MBB6052690.1 spermidine synthase [Armatimonas rosea]
MQEQDRREALTLLTSVFLVAACGLIYELLLATISSYLIGSSVTQFSLCIGVFIGAMGIGSYISQFVTTNLMRWFLTVEILLAVVGGVSAWALFGAYSYLGSIYYAALFLLIGLIGGLVGIELPLLTRLLSQYGALKETIAQALSFDYVGSLLGSIAFPLVLLPALGMTRTAFVVGLLNLGIAVWNLKVFAPRLKSIRPPLVLCAFLAAFLASGLVVADQAGRFFEKRLYDDEILFARQTPYQKIVVTRFREDLRLYLDGNLQFSSLDEHRYHESLIHPALSLAAVHESVLVLGGGDGLGVREVLKWPGVKQVVLVDIDPAMTKIARTYPSLRAQNAGALDDPRVTLVHEDAFTYLNKTGALFSVIIGDLPDPNSEALAKLYSREFYAMIRRHLAPGGMFVTQATSPLFSRDAFWCIERTVHAAGFATTPYHVYVPSFGDWGFVLARDSATAPKLTDTKLTGLSVKYLTDELLPTLTVFDADSKPTLVSASTLDRPQVVRHYERGAKRWE